MYRINPIIKELLKIDSQINTCHRLIELIVKERELLREYKVYPGKEIDRKVEDELFKTVKILIKKKMEVYNEFRTELESRS